MLFLELKFHIKFSETFWFLPKYRTKQKLKEHFVVEHKKWMIKVVVWENREVAKTTQTSTRNVKTTFWAHCHQYVCMAIR